VDEIRLIVGLGNPGEKYERTRHNAGYWWVEAVAEARRAGWKRETRFSGLTAKVEEGGREFHLLKPTTYMNESGRSVSALMRFFKIEPASLLVVHDELDLPPGAVKMKRGGGTGGHNGLSDIAESLGTKDFWRLRVGIGHPGDRDLVADYVLDKPRRAEKDAIDPPFERSLGLLARLASGKLQDAMAWLHTSPEDEARRAAALEARKAAPGPPDDTSPKEKP
jgi:PTH1 family peptidyl-tRNA hydrolase